MNNQFLQHLKSLTPEGKAEEKKIFIPADKFKPKTADKIDMGDDVEQLDEIEGRRRPYKRPTTTQFLATLEKQKKEEEAKKSSAAGDAKKKEIKEDEQLDEATRSKYIKAYRRHKVGTDTTKLDIADAKRNAAVLRRGGADDDTIRKGSFTGKTPMSHYNKVNMAKYRFGSKAARSMEDGKKSPRNVSEGSLGMKKGIRMSNAVINKGHTQIGQRAQSAELRSISKTNKEAGGTGRITTTPTKYKFSNKEYEVMQGHARKGISGKIRRNAVRAARMRGAMGGPEMNEENLKSSKYLDRMPSALRSAVKIHDKIKGTKNGVSAPKKFAAGRFSHQMTPAEYQQYFGRPKPVSESKKTNPIKKKYKTGKKIAKRVIKKLGQALMTPQDAIDVMITGRNF